MKIVVLDGYCLNPGDLSWDALKALGEVIIYDRTDKDKVIERAFSADIILTNKTVIDKSVIDALPSLKHIAVMATGYNVVDCAYAREKEIDVSNVPTYGTESVVQTVFSLILELSIGTGAHSFSTKGGEWPISKDFCYYKQSLVEIAGKTLGIVGYGRIGKRVAEVAKAFGMAVLAYNIDEKGQVSKGDFFVSLDTLLRESDIVSLNCPLTDDNRGMINADAISKMKQGAIIINTARGPLIVEQDLADALNSGRLGGAGLDVLSKEPPEATNPLLSSKNTVITPHIAWATFEARSRLMEILVSNVALAIEGKKQNIVNK